MLVCIVVMSPLTRLRAQTNYFVDGYHGGIYGHYPLWVTKFMADNTEQHKDWRLNLEIEPETWDIVALKDPENYERIKKIINDSSLNAIAEYVNPAYGQSYFFNNSAESTIRQFQYGIEKLREHFPLIRFTTYSSEEPCFTSSLPQILKSFGFKYASLKNPNTCWGGYVRAYGGETLNWTGPDGSSILTVPRYSSEDLQDNSTWQTIAWNHSKKFIEAATRQGIELPVGMCLQDAGWRNGPWLNNHKQPSTQYTTWRSYFNLIENKNNTENWRLSQEDIQVSLVWGSQVLQRIAQQIRAAENKLRMAEKLAALATLYHKAPYPTEKIDSAWKKIMLSQHHDCWIVPYNRLNDKTWAENVREWTRQANIIAENIIQQSLKTAENFSASSKPTVIKVYNPTSYYRNEIVSVDLKHHSSGSFIIESNGKTIPHQLLKQNDSTCTILFKATVPPLGGTSYSVLPGKKQTKSGKGAFISTSQDSSYIMETDLYRLVIDGAKGNIRQLTAKYLNNKNFIAAGQNTFNTLRGYFYKENGLVSSIENKPVITILENGPLQIKIQVENSINGNKFVQTVQLQQGEKKIDMKLHIHYNKGTGIGDDYMQYGNYKAEDRRKAFFNDTSKLLVTFPLNLEDQKVYKDAPLDVTESRLSNTFYNRWDEIKNNVLLNWVDVTDQGNNYGMALFSDHVTSYSHGSNFPLSLTVQYAGVGLWGRNYFIDGPTDIHYSLLPHSGNWQKAQLNKEATTWNEPLTVSINNSNNIRAPFIKKMDPGLEATALYYKGSDLYVRITNTGSMQHLHRIEFNCSGASLHFVELNDRVTSSLHFDASESIAFDCDIPLFGFKTVKLVHAKLKD